MDGGQHEYIVGQHNNLVSVLVLLDIEIDWKVVIALLSTKRIFQ